MVERAVERGWVARELAEEFPDLALSCLTLDARPHRSPEPVRRRLGQMAGRITGGHVIHMRQDPVPWAYRVFWRQVGIDPDVDRTPVERFAVDRLTRGGLPSRNLVADAITIATLETGVAITAFDADRVAGLIGLRLSGDGEPLGGSGPRLADRQIVIADEERALALIGGEAAAVAGVTPATKRVAIAAAQVKGVPDISVEEALWTAADVLSGGR